MGQRHGAVFGGSETAHLKAWGYLIYTRPWPAILYLGDVVYHNLPCRLTVLRFGTSYQTMANLQVLSFGFMCIRN